MKREYSKKALSILLVAFMTIAMIPMLTTPVKGATDAQIEASGAAAVAYLASVQNPQPVPPPSAGPNGSWGSGGEFVAKTGLVLLKFLARAQELNLDPFDNDPLSPTYYQYANNVIAGFNYLFGTARVVSISPQTHGNPDTNGNGRGIVFGTGYDVYNTGIALTALAITGHPNDRSAVIGILGSRTYKQIAQDTVDWLCFAQGDLGNDRGGFGYTALNNNTSPYGAWTDNSNAGYAYLGLAFAEDPPFSCTVPQWVKDELNMWITTIQDPVNGDADDGGSYYNPDWGPTWENVLKTGNLIFEMAFYGDSPSTQRVKDAVAYLERHWRDPNMDPGWGYSLPVANYQAKFLVEKGLTYMGIDKIDTDGDGVADDDWFNQEPPAVPAEDFASVIVAQQLPSGGWPQSLGAHDYYSDAILSTAWAVLTLERFAPPPEFGKRLVPEEGGLGTVVHVTISVNVGQGQTVAVVDKLPTEFSYLDGTFTVNGVPATPTITKIGPPPPVYHEISYTLTEPGTYLIEFDCKVDSAYWEDREVCNVVVGTWYDEAGEVIREEEAIACFIIHAFEELHKGVGVPKKVKVIPAPVQFWREFIGGVTDIIVFDPPEITEPVALVRDYVVLHDGEGPIPLELLTWNGTEGLPWEPIDTPEEPLILPPDGVAEYDIMIDPTATAVLVRYTVAWASSRDVIEAKFVNEAILEKSSPQVIVGQLSNFDVHNDYPEPVDNFELELYGIDPSDVVDWFPGWGAPPQINAISGGTEIIWMDETQPVPPCVWVHFGLHLKPGVIATGIKAYWTQLDGGLVIKEKTNVQWRLEFEVSNPFSYTMTNVVITDRLGAELEVDPPFPYSITHGTVSYTTRGTSRKVFLTWNIGNLLPGETARLIVLVSTDYNPGRGDCNEDNVVNMLDAAYINAHWNSYDRNADINCDDRVDVFDAAIINSVWGQSTTGHQEYTEPGIYEMNSGATLKFIDPEQDMQLSAVTDSIYVTVLPLEDP